MKKSRKLSKIWNMTQMFTFITFIQYSAGSPNQSNLEREKKRISKLERKKSNCHYLQLTRSYLKKTPKLHQKLLELINEFSKCARIQN